MGGEHDRLTAAEAASVIGWWVEAGVDVAIAEEPRAWLGVAGAPVAEPAAPAVEASDLPPSTLEAFRTWLGETKALPLAGPRRVLPIGVAAPDIMLLADMPAAEDMADGQPIGGEAWSLTERMLAAIGFSGEQAYVATLTCSHSPGARLFGDDLETCAAIARRHVALVKPKRLLLFGDTAARALLGKPLTAARGHVHKIEGVRTVASFHPRQLLQRASNKALAWRDLLLLMEEEV